ncbi:hypothetical protein GYMLUDRAFT_57627 [Collybiopsis luxurians FD-317 M1]|uniref:Uncharacterized protein n=1 Tax=Collybiopsis luxurians FD-317 M1 TaxID=944289 RepID=A0A0D0CKJ3_9AGAR|nr:hypothetical protein GYMLUDRAFT_57627 [Collybiopsis luxurians FD-317 M1]
MSRELKRTLPAGLSIDVLSTIMKMQDVPGMSRFSKCSSSLCALSIPILCSLFSIPNANVCFSAWLFWRNCSLKERNLITGLTCGQKVYHGDGCLCSQCTETGGDRYYLCWVCVHDILVSSTPILNLSFCGLSLPYAFYHTARSWQQHVMLSISGCTLTAWRRSFRVRARTVEFHLNSWYHLDEQPWQDRHSWTGFGLELSFLKCCDGLTEAVLHWCPETAWILADYHAFALSQLERTLGSVPRSLLTSMHNELARTPFPNTLTYLGVEVDDDSVAQLCDGDCKKLAELIGPLLAQTPEIHRLHLCRCFPRLHRPIITYNPQRALQELLGPVLIVRSLIATEQITNLFLTDWGIKPTDVISLLTVAPSLTQLETYLQEWDIDVLKAIIANSTTIKQIHLWFQHGSIVEDADAIFWLLLKASELEHLTLCNVGCNFDSYDDGPRRFTVPSHLKSVRFSLSSVFQNLQNQWLLLCKDLCDVKRISFDKDT